MGVYLIINKKWMIVALYSKPYKTINDQEYYLHPLCIGGIINLPYEEKKWPQTAGMKIHKDNLFEVTKNIYSE
jgi:hypothetical protein